MKRRDFLGTAGAGALLTGGLLSGCDQQAEQAGAGAAMQQHRWFRSGPQPVSENEVTIGDAPSASESNSMLLA